MKKYLKPDLLPLLALATGMIGMLLQLWQYVGGTDEKGLILRGHISAILLLILTVIVLALILLGTWNLREGNLYRFNFPASVPGCVGAGLAAVMFFWFCKKEYVEAEVNKGRNKPMFTWFYPLCKYVLCPICFFVLIIGALTGGIG